MGFFDNYKDKNVAAVEAATQDTETPEGAEATKEEEKVVEMPKKKPFAIWNVKGEDYKMVWVLRILWRWKVSTKPIS